MSPLKTLALTLAATTTFALPAFAQAGHHRGGTGQAILYAHPDFTGASVRVTGPVNHLRDLRFNDKASSIRITGGSWEVCADPNFRGRCEVVTYREGRLNQVRLNDKITSIRPVGYGRTENRWDRRDRYDRHEQRRWGNRGDRFNRGHDRNAPVVLFQHDEFRGDTLPVTGAVPHLNRLRFNDKVSSIAINSGQWEVCTDPNYRGRCEIINASASNLGYYRLNDKITSIRPAGRYGRRW
jgi:hypothetical protein